MMNATPKRDVLQQAARGDTTRLHPAAGKKRSAVVAPPPQPARGTKRPGPAKRKDTTARITIDPIDLRIISALRTNGRKSNVDLARELGVTETTIRKRLRRLTETDVMRVVALTDPYKLGFVTDCLIALSVDVDKILDVGQRLAELEEVRYVALSTGAYDLILACLFRSNDELLEFLTTKLAGIPGIKQVATSHVLRVFKRTYDWVTPGLDSPRSG